jgi:stage III sporulation protein AB
VLFKIIGSIIVITACSILGYVLSKSYSRRPQEIREIQVMLNMFENEIVYMQSFLEDAFIKLGNSSASKSALFFTDAVRLLKSEKGIDASKAWEKAVRQNIHMTSLNHEDEKILVSFGKMLGNSDREGQVKNISLLVNQLGLQEKKAEETREKNEGMYKRLGVLCGFAIVILLF